MKAQLHLRNLQILRLEHEIHQLTTQLPGPQAEPSVLISQPSSMEHPNTVTQHITNEAKQAWRSHRDAKPYDPPSSSHYKEGLYAELTGLMIRDVIGDHSTNDLETTFDCIQTGRNGSEFNKPSF
jgi:hypothetical protein